MCSYRIILTDLGTIRRVYSRKRKTDLTNAVQVRLPDFSRFAKRTLSVHTGEKIRIDMKVEHREAQLRDTARRQCMLE